MKTGFVTSGRYPVRYRDEGSGMPLLFLHGYLESLNIWSDFTSAFADSFRVISMDLPGHGQTGVPGTVSTMDEMADAAVRVLDERGIGKCFAIGHSMGGYATLAMLERHPVRLSGFCLFHSHARADTPAVIEKRSREIRVVEEGHSRLLAQQNVPNMFAEDNLPLFQKELRFTRRIVRKTPDAGIVAAIRGMMTRPDRSAILAGAPVPCLHIIGKKDKYIPFEEVALSTVLPSGSERLILEHTGHMGFFEEKARAFEEMLRFLKKI